MVRASARSVDVRAEVAELLGVRADDVHPSTNLIGQGLDSLRMMTLAGRWRRRGVPVDFATLAATPTIEAWSGLVTADAPPEDTERPPAGVADDAAGEPFALAPMQHAMWVGRQDNQLLGGVAGHLYVEFDGGAIDPGRLRAAATELARRHPMLRVEFLPDGTQRIAATGDAFPVAVEDLRHLGAVEVDQRLAAIRDAKSQQQLDGAVFELALTRLPGERSRLHVDLDMQAADAMSYRTLMADLATLYRGHDLPALDYSYRQYRRAVEADEARPQPARDADRNWWAQRIPQLPDPPSLPTAGDRGSTVAASAVALAGSRNPRRPVFPRPGPRAHPGDDPGRVVLPRPGPLVDQLPLPAERAAVRSAAAAPRRRLARRRLHLFAAARRRPHRLADRGGAGGAVQDAMRTAAAHAAYPGLSVLRDLSRHRGTQVLAPVVFTSALGLGPLFGDEVTAQFGAPAWIISQGPQVLLDAQVTELDGGVLVNWDVREGVFAPGVVEAMFAYHIDELLRLASADEDWDAPGPSPLPAAQRAVRDRVNGRIAEPSGEALHDGFFRQAGLRPDAPAVVSSSGELSYAQLRDRALAVAAALRAAGVGVGDTVAVAGPKTAEQIPALLGILSVGAVYLPIGIDQPRDRAERILRTGAVRLALVCGGQLLALPVPELILAEVLRGAPAAADLPRVDPAQLAYVLFTSGSTGEPKGVEVTHDAAMNTVEFIAHHFEIGPADRCLALSTLEGDISVMDVFVTLRTGGSIVVVDEAQRRDPDAWARLIDAHQVTVLHFMPGWLEMLIEVGHGRLSSVRVIPTGGDWVRPELARRLRAEAPNLRFAGLGGATETPVHNTIFEVADAASLPADWTALPYGVPLPNNACRVVDDTGDDCPDWVAGELWVSGRGIARGYRGRPDLTAERFVERAGRRWYRTGDLARYWPDGTLEFVGRADHRVKISGYRVELGEIETALRRLPGVAIAVAALLPGAGGSEALAAAVCPESPGAGLTAERMRELMAELVPAHMIPRHIALVRRIPFTDAGKIDRRAVARDLGAAVSASERPGHSAPATPLESALAALLGELLGVDTVGRDDDFFALGGDSVLATQAVGRIRTWLDTPHVVVADVFATRTVAALAALLIDREGGGARLDQVAELYLEVSQMDADTVLSASRPAGKAVTPQ